VFPAGLSLYIFTNTVLSALHSIYMNKFDKKSLVIAEQLKKNQEAAAAALLNPTAKPGGSVKSTAGTGGVAKAKRVIDTKATDVLPDDQADDGADPDDGPADAGGPPGSARNRPRRKKRRR
jgi:hypothetical protein